VHDDLAAVPPEEFIAARDALAARLKAEGEVDEAAAIKKLRKPTVSQWLVEHVRRTHTDEIEALRAAVRDLSAAQETAITGGDRTALTNATAARRDAVASLERVVEQMLADGDRPAHYRDEVVQAIESGVTTEIASGTFGLRDDLELPDRPADQPRRDIGAERRAAAAQSAIEHAEDRVERAREELARAEAELDAVRKRYES
jgi:hypothetical protein